MIYEASLIAEKTWLILECGFNAIYYLEGEDRGLLIDTGVGAGDLKGFISTIATKPYDVILTHGHLDHVGAVPQFNSVMVHRDDHQLIRDSLSNEERRGFIEHMSVMSEGRSPDFESTSMVLYKDELPKFVDIEDGAFLQLGNRALRIVHTPGHTAGSICIIDEYNNIAFIGDTIIYRLLLLAGPKDYRERLRAWMKATEFLYDTEEPFDVLYMGHTGAVPDNTKTELREIARLLIEDINKITYENGVPKYSLGSTQLYFDYPKSLKFTTVR